MHIRSVWLKLFGVEGAVLEGVEWAGGLLRLRVHLQARKSRRCPVCDRECPGYDHKEKPHVWRALDLGVVRAEVSAVLHRVACPEHGVLLERVPWARQGSTFTRHFEDTVAWLATRTDKTSVSALMRVAWMTVGNILERVCREQRATAPALRVTRLGIDEVSYRRGHRYLTVVVDHDTGRLLFAHPGKDAAALSAFFEQLGKDGCAAIELVSLDGAAHWHEVVRRFCPNARLCLDPFHVVQWVTKALDDIRRRVWRAARQAGHEDAATVVKNMRWALLKNPENLTAQQSTTLRLIEMVNKPLYRGYLLKEQLRQVFTLKGDAAIKLLDKWLQWVRRCRLPEFIAVAKTITNNRAAIEDALRHGLSNARVEALNTRMQLITRRAFGFHSADALIALAYLKLGGLCPPLPHTAATHSR